VSPIRAAAAALGGAAVAVLAAACASAGPRGPIDAEVLYRARCALCHPAWSPTDFSPSEWPRFVRKYAPRSGLTQAERDAVLAYLVREAGRR
jgi:hypothetical protein